MELLITIFSKDNATGITLLNELNVAVSTLANIPVGQYDVTVTETGTLLAVLVKVLLF